MPSFNHDLVPDYLRTKPTPELEDEEKQLEQEKGGKTADNILKQVRVLFFIRISSLPDHEHEQARGGDAKRDSADGKESGRRSRGAGEKASIARDYPRRSGSVLALSLIDYLAGDVQRRRDNETREGSDGRRRAATRLPQSAARSSAASATMISFFLLSYTNEMFLLDEVT